MTLPDNLFLRFDEHRWSLERNELPAPKHKERLSDLLLALILSLGGAAGLGIGLYDMSDGAALIISGQPVEAKQLAHRTANRDNYITYTYTVESQRHQREGRVSSAKWRAFCEGCPINARYARSKPQISRLDAESPVASGIFTAAFGGVFCLMGLWAGASCWQGRRKLARRKRSAKLRFGTLLDATIREDNRHVRWIKLHYRLDGADASQTVEWVDSPRLPALPAPGARLAFSFEADDNLELL